MRQAKNYVVMVSVSDEGRSSLSHLDPHLISVPECDGRVRGPEIDSRHDALPAGERGHAPNILFLPSFHHHSNRLNLVPPRERRNRKVGYGLAVGLGTRTVCGLQDVLALREGSVVQL